LDEKEKILEKEIGTLSAFILKNDVHILNKDTLDQVITINDL